MPLDMTTATDAEVRVEVSKRIYRNLSPANRRELVHTSLNTLLSAILVDVGKALRDELSVPAVPGSMRALLEAEIVTALTARVAADPEDDMAQDMLDELNR